jgi:hypothetical protein
MDATVPKTLPQTSPKESCKQDFHTHSKWSLLRNVVNAITRFKSAEVKVVNDIEGLISEVKSKNTSGMITRVYSSRDYFIRDAINEHKISDLLFRYLRAGDLNDLKKIEEILENDPRVFIRSQVDNEFLVNKCNLLGHTPMYESTMHGNLEAVQLLLKHGANPHIKSKVDQHEFESNLEVASRWNHIKIVEFLLEATVWSYIEVKHAAKVASNVAIKKTLIEYLNKHYVRRLCCFKRYFK